jgi:hypothetical protein
LQEHSILPAVIPISVGKVFPMLWTIAVVLIILWALGFLAFHVAGGLIHLLLVIAVVVIIFQLITGRRAL